LFVHLPLENALTALPYVKPTSRGKGLKGRNENATPIPCVKPTARRQGKKTTVIEWDDIPLAKYGREQICNGGKTNFLTDVSCGTNAGKTILTSLRTMVGGYLWVKKGKRLCTLDLARKIALEGNWPQ